MIGHTGAVALLPVAAALAAVMAACGSQSTVFSGTASGHFSIGQAGTYTISLTVDSAGCVPPPDGTAVLVSDSGLTEGLPNLQRPPWTVTLYLPPGNWQFMTNRPNNYCRPGPTAHPTLTVSGPD